MASKQVHNVQVYILAIIASMGAIMFGYDLAFIGTSISLKSFQKDFHLIDKSRSERDAFAANVVSLLQAGCFFGSLASGPFADKFGRRIGLMAASVFFLIGSCMQTWASGSKGLLYAGRAVGGVGIGAASGLVPLFVSESSPPIIRGRLVGIYEIGVQLGTLLGFWINYGVEKHVKSGSEQYKIPFAIQLIPGGLLLLGMLIVPDSPRWTAETKGREATLTVLSRFRQLPKDHPDVQEEAAVIIASIEEERMLVPDKSFLGQCQELFGQPLNRRRIIYAALIFVFMQWAGSNAINYYSSRIFASIGLGGTSTALVSTGLYGTVRFVVVCIAMYFLVDRYGRTTLLLIGSTGMAVCMYYLGGFVQTHPISGSETVHTSASSIVAAVAVYVYAVFFSMSWAGIPWIYTSEMFPTIVRSLAISIAAATHWLMNFVIARSVPYMISNIDGGAYFLFAACLTLSIPFVWFFLPETKGRKLEDMDILFLDAHRNKYGRMLGGEGSRQDVVVDVAFEKAGVDLKETA